MASHSSSDSAAAITITGGIVVVTMRPDMDREQFDSMRRSVLDRIASTKSRVLVLDFSGIDVMNLLEFNRIRKLLVAVRLLGAETAIVSLAAGIVLYLTEVQADTAGISYFLGLDEAIQQYGGR